MAEIEPEYTTHYLGTSMLEQPLPMTLSPDGFTSYVQRILPRHLLWVALNHMIAPRMLLVVSGTILALEMEPIRQTKLGQAAYHWLKYVVAEETEKVWGDLLSRPIMKPDLTDNFTKSEIAPAKKVRKRKGGLVASLPLLEICRKGVAGRQAWKLVVAILSDIGHCRFCNLRASRLLADESLLKKLEYCTYDNDYIVCVHQSNMKASLF